MGTFPNIQLTGPYGFQPCMDGSCATLNTSLFSWFYYEILENKLSTFFIPHQNLYTRTFVNENGKSVYLTAKEFDLLYFLSSHKGQVFTKEQIYENVWGYDNAPDASNLSSFIRKLRLKIEPHPDNPRYIITVWGVGYKFSGEEKP